uniref:Uncharacterized protein n=1 Tax=Schlesneria paludicola TaxID=360056 RepID=A0A7C4LII1_9PLAN
MAARQPLHGGGYRGPAAKTIAQRRYAEDRRRYAEDRRDKAEDRRDKAEDRRDKGEDRAAGFRFRRLFAPAG